MDGTWQNETEEKQSVTCPQTGEGPAHYATEQELNYFIRIEPKQTKPLVYVNSAAINKWCQAPFVDILCNLSTLGGQLFLTSVAFHFLLKWRYKARRKKGVEIWEGG